MKKQLHLLFGLFFVNLITAQNLPNDCVNSITVKSNGVFTSDVSSGSGKQEVSGCNNSHEHNTVWLRVVIAQSGTLGFDLIPNDPDISVDFDFWVFAANRTCSSLGSPIRCCVTNPNQAGLTNNLIGINGSTLATSAWSGGGNNLPYVQWLTVNFGESYYIAIDRPYATPSGDTGFQIKWTGTATVSSTPTPVANAIPDYMNCTTTPGVAIFNLNDVRSQINSDLTNNTVTFYTTMANAIDGVNPLPDIYQNTSNPQTIYAKVRSNAGWGYAISNFNLRAVPVPTASIALSKQVVCAGAPIVVTFTGTPGATVDFTIDGGSIQSVLLDASGTYLLSNSASSNRTYALVKAKIIDGNNVVKCFQNLSDTKTVAVIASPTISGDHTIHVGESTQLAGSGTPATLNAWTSSSPSVATVSSTGLVSGVSAGMSGVSYTDSNGCSRGTDLIVTASNLAVETPALKDFSAKVYPNPFNTAFVIDVNMLSQEPLKIKVYDMLGRLVEQMEGNPSKMAEQKIGQNYASGIYNIVITQEDVMKTVRIIKE